MDDKYYKTLVERYLDKKASNDELIVFTYLMKEGKLDHLIKAKMDEEIKIMITNRDAEIRFRTDFDDEIQY
ncbi:hypothetical protein SNE25_06725 [Mucilaginibacter sabulilitoris]|uniref:Phage protein n=1 Tax=Mucilaginibacter sabulilitoris TaxID=1173583 RepID=A0ABZ0TPZ4_9SPHI|nr:hypothetical protein [Mucilaginibacter sabulilitoris]WPU95216.1 hypothetical protein SNE25_06725 [Mucilaginibacter sabulilitoris]